MKKRSGQNKRPKSDAAAKKAKRTGGHRGPKTKIMRLKSTAAAAGGGARRGPKTGIRMLGSPALVQMLMRAAADNNVMPARKTERPIRQSVAELLIRLGHDVMEARQLTDMIMEQMQ